MWIESATQIRVEFKTRTVHLQPGVPTEVPDEDGRKLLAQVPGKVRQVSQELPSSPSPHVPPDAPLLPGWVICWRDSQGLLHGGRHGGSNGVVRQCVWTDGMWTVRLASGANVLLRHVVSVAKTKPDGSLAAAWLVRVHGYDGEGPQPDVTKEGGG